MIGRGCIEQGVQIHRPAIQRPATRSISARDADGGHNAARRSACLSDASRRSSAATRRKETARHVCHARPDRPAIGSARCATGDFAAAFKAGHRHSKLATGIRVAHVDCIIRADAHSLRDSSRISADTVVVGRRGPARYDLRRGNQTLGAVGREELVHRAKPVFRGLEYGEAAIGPSVSRHAFGERAIRDVSGVVIAHRAGLTHVRLRLLCRSGCDTALRSRRSNRRGSRLNARSRNQTSRLSGWGCRNYRCRNYIGRNDATKIGIALIHNRSRLIGRGCIGQGVQIQRPAIRSISARDNAAMIEEHKR